MTAPVGAGAWEREVQLRDGRVLRLRAIRPSDADSLRRHFARLSPAAVYHRFHHLLPALPDAMVETLVSPDGRTHVGLVACDGDDLVATARFFVGPAPGEAEFAMAVLDDWQGLGLGRELLASLVEAAERLGLERLVGHVLPDNTAMLALLARSTLPVTWHRRADESVAQIAVGSSGSKR